MKWIFEQDAEPLCCSDGFWYGLIEGGYVEPSEVLADQDQIDKLNEAIALVASFQAALEAADLWEEM